MMRFEFVLSTNNYEYVCEKCGTFTDKKNPCFIIKEIRDKMWGETYEQNLYICRKCFNELDEKNWAFRAYFLDLGIKKRIKTVMGNRYFFKCLKALKQEYCILTENVKLLRESIVRILREKIDILCTMEYENNPFWQLILFDIYNFDLTTNTMISCPEQSLREINYPNRYEVVAEFDDLNHYIIDIIEFSEKFGLVDAWGTPFIYSIDKVKSDHISVFLNNEIWKYNENEMEI